MAVSKKKGPCILLLLLLWPHWFFSRHGVEARCGKCEEQGLGTNDKPSRRSADENQGYSKCGGNQWCSEFNVAIGMWWRVVGSSPAELTLFDLRKSWINLLLRLFVWLVALLAPLLLCSHNINWIELISWLRMVQARVGQRLWDSRKKCHLKPDAGS